MSADRSGFTSAYRRTHIRTGSAGSLSMFQQPNGPASGHHASEEELRCILEFHQQNEPIIKLTDTQSRIRWRAPSSGTRKWPPSSWCPRSDLVPEGFRPGRFLRQRQQHHSEEQNGEILSELATIKTNGTLTCNVTVYSINGGAHAQVQTVSKIDDSFPGVDSIEHKPVHPFAGQPQPISNDLKRPPKWLKQPPGACFGFGGKLDTFNGTSRIVIVNQVVTDRELIERSKCWPRALAPTPA
ncbi:hypothetical protein quinque_007453 [Culex quinquefasciatus]